MDDDLKQLVKRFLTGYGIADCSLVECVNRIGQPYGDRDAPLRVLDRTSDVRVALEYLSMLSWPASRHVAVAVGYGCTAFINNGRNGSDYADQKVWLARYLDSRFARIVNREGRTWSNGSDHETLEYAATIFELYGSDGEAIRAVTCMDDGGRWTFGEAGERHSVENAFPYAARRKRDRFMTAQLELLAAAFHIPTLRPEEFMAAQKYYLIESTAPTSNLCTLAEADDPAYLYYLRGLGWVPRMERHASSVVADFERCLQLNPSYGSKVRDHLERAYRILESGEDV